MSGESELLVATAMRMEARALRRGAPELALLRCGVGAARARRGAARLAESPARRIVVAGLCGALDPELAPGDVVVASRVFALDVPERSAEVALLRRALEARGLAVHEGPLLSVKRPVRGPRRAALARTGAVAVDMESAWLARGAGSRPLGLVRVVMDGPRHELLRPDVLARLRRGLAVLRQVAPALESWRPEPHARRASGSASSSASTSGAGVPAGRGGDAGPGGAGLAAGR